METTGRTYQSSFLHTRLSKASSTRRGVSLRSEAPDLASLLGTFSGSEDAEKDGFLSIADNQGEKRGGMNREGRKDDRRG